MEYHLRQATPADAEALVEMHTLAHEECYSHVLPAEFFAARRASLPERTESRRPSLAGPSAPVIALDDDGRIVGFAHGGPGRDEDRPDQQELYAIYTLRTAHGSGLGAALLHAAVGPGPAYLWVLEDNPRARAFYARHGFAPDGTRKLLPKDWFELPEIRLERR